MFKRKLGLALGGGGARGLAHIGVLKHLENEHIQLHALSGTSSGAIIASMYAFGVPTEVMAKEIVKLKSTDWTQFRFKGLGLFHNEQLEEMLTKLLPKSAVIEEAKIKLGIKATDLITGNPVDLLSGDVVKAVMASSCVPGVYMPIEVDKMLLVDGGITENVPLSLLKKLGANFYIGVNLNGNHLYGRPDGIIDVLTNAMDIAIDSHTRAQLRHADIVLSMDLTQFSRTSTEKSLELIAIGESEAKLKIGASGKFFLWGLIKKSWRNLWGLSPFAMKWPSIFKRQTSK